MSQVHKSISLKKEIGKNIMKKESTSAGFSLENRKKIREALKRTKTRKKCCGR